jgi:hypothetical protein
MLIKIKNLTAGPVSLPGPLPRLSESQMVIVEITPENFDLYREELNTMQLNRTIDLEESEAPGSGYDLFAFNDDAGEITWRGIVIAGPGTSDDQLVKVTSADTTPDFLSQKIVNGGGLIFSILSVGGNEKLSIKSNAALTNLAPVDVTKSLAQAGTYGEAARQDHKHDISTAAPARGVGGGNTESVGGATSVARSDHDHKLRETGGPTDLTIGVIADGQTLRRVGTVISGYQDLDVLTKISATDGTADYLDPKVVGSGGTTTAIITVGTYEKLQITSPALSSTAPVNVTRATADAGSATESSKRDHKHDVSTAAPTQGIGGNNSAGVASTLISSDHDHKLRETGGPTDLTIAAIADNQVVRRSGTTLVGGTREFAPNTTDPSGTISDGDRYYNTTLKKWMVYDSSRTKWLSEETITMPWGRAGNTAAGSYYAGMAGIFTAVLGFPATRNGTVIAFGYTRSDNDAATFEITSNGTAIATLASSATSGTSTTLNADMSAGNILGVRNQTGGNVVSDAQGWVMIKWRA